MSVIERVVKPTTRKGKKVLQRREPQVIETTKRALFFKGRKTSEIVRRSLKDIYDLKKPDSQMFSKKNNVTIFEDATPVEAFCRKHECGLFMLGSHSKKRPNNLVIGRMFNYSLLDMVELHIESYEGLREFAGSKVTVGIKPCLLFNGPQWEQSDELKQLKSIFIDFFHREQIESIRLQGIEHTISFNATADGRICLRSYKVMLKKSGVIIPRVELEEIGPRIDFTLRRTKLASADLMKEACKKARELTAIKKKNISSDPFGTIHGRIHMGNQNINKIQTRKLKGLKKTVEERRTLKRKALVENNDTYLKRQREEVIYGFAEVEKLIYPELTITLYRLPTFLQVRPELRFHILEMLQCHYGIIFCNMNYIRSVRGSKGMPIKRFYTSKATLDQIIRVDHAGELGADRIYAGQMAVLGSTSKGPLIQHMWDQEKQHRAKFEELIRKHRVRPTVMAPFWDAAAFALGAGTALLGEKSAMACTVAVETVIVEHYNDQLRTLLDDPECNKELMEVITKFRNEEQEHHDTGIDHGAKQAPYYSLLSEAIKSGCKLAIAISKVI